jgi:nicotinamide-nucleotide amidase
MTLTDPAARAAEVLAALRERRTTLATAESLTGGLVGAALTSVPGSSTSYVGGVVSYATDLKVGLLDVPASVVDEDGVVSRACALAMARGVRARTGADWGLATTGVAGPGDQDGVAAGTVWVAASGPDGEQARLLRLAGDRAEVRRAACVAALDLVLEIQPSA